MTTETTLDQMKVSYDWEHIFGEGNYTGNVKLEDVEEVLGSLEGHNDGPDWVGVFKLKDGRFMVIRAGCDYTGWGCQEGGSHDISDNLDHLQRFQLTDEERNRLGVKLEK